MCIRDRYWPAESAKEDFRGTKWSSLSWQPMIEATHFTDAATGSSANVKRGDTQLAIFKLKGKYYATQQMCPHKRAFALSDGLLGDSADGKLWVSCPMHKRNYELKGPEAGKCGNDDSVNIAVFQVEEREDGWVYVKLPPVEELDGVLGTSKWKVTTKDSEDPYAKLDEKLKKDSMKGYKGRKVQSESHLSKEEGGLGEMGKAAAILRGEEKNRDGGMDW